MGAFTAAESNNQIEAENSSHQALKRAWEQLSYRIRYDKSKTITARCDTELEKNKRTSKTKLTFQVERCCSICHWWPGVFLSGFPVVVWARPGLAQHAPASHWETWLHAGLRSVELVLVLHQRALHTGRLHAGLDCTGSSHRHQPGWCSSTVDPAGRWVLPPPPLRQSCCSKPAGRLLPGINEHWAT